MFRTRFVELVALNLVHLKDFHSKILESFVTRMKPFVSDQDYILATVLAPNYKLWFFEIYHKSKLLGHEFGPLRPFFVIPTS